MASSLLLTTRCIGKSGFRSHFPCNPEVDVVITKVQRRFPLTPTLKKTTARLSTYHPNGDYSRVSPSELVEGVGVHEPSCLTKKQDYEPYTTLSKVKLRRNSRPNNAGPSSPRYPATSILARKILRDYWGYPGFRLEQEAVISRLIAGGSASAVFPTGSGKSLLYQVPALAFDQLDKEAKGNPPGLTLVISPLIALMKDQTEDLVARGIKAASLTSSMDDEAKIKVYNLIENNEIRLLYCSPERLINEKFVEHMRRTRIHMIAIDEVHCVAEWGNSFRPGYLKIASFIKEIGVQRVLCLTATSTPEVTANVCSIFGIPQDGLFKESTYRPNLQLLAKSFGSVSEKLGYMKSFLTGNPGASVIYVTFRKQTKSITKFLATFGIKALPYHAGMSFSSRAEVQEEFMKSENTTIVATIAFGLGINKPNIRNIIHFDCPRSLEQYSQEIGRAGRDGKPSKGIIFLSPGDNKSREILRLSGRPSKSNIGRFFRQLFKNNSEVQPGDTIKSDSVAQSEELDTRPSAIDVLYSLIESHTGLIRRISPIKSSRYPYELLKKPPSEGDAEFLAQAILKLSKRIEAPRETEFVTVDIDEVADAVEVSRSDVLEKLEGWNNSGFIDLGYADTISRYRVLKPFPKTRPAVQEIVDIAYNELKARDTETAKRSEKVIELITGKSCYARGLAAHFEDMNSVPVRGCGNCQWCLTKQKITLKGKTKRKLNAARIKAVLAACPDRSDPELLAKIAFGAMSPKIAKYQYGKSNKVFGSMDDYKFNDLVDGFESYCNDANENVAEDEDDGDIDRQQAEELNSR